MMCNKCEVFIKYKHARDYFVCKLYKHARGQFRLDTAPRTQRVENEHGVLETGTLFQKVLHKPKYIPCNCTICIAPCNLVRACPPISMATNVIVDNTYNR